MNTTPEDTELREKISDFMVDLMLVVSAEKLNVGADKLDTQFAINQGNKLIQAHNSRLSEIMNLITLHTQKELNRAIGEDTLSASEVGVDARYKGAWDDNAYILNELRAEQRARARLTDPTEAGEK